MRANNAPLAFEDVLHDEPGPGEVPVKTVASGIRHSDLHRDRGRAAGATHDPGHEPAGIVERIGPGVTDFKPGDHVIGCITNWCGVCRFCTGGRPYLRLTQYVGQPAGEGRLTAADGSAIHQFANLSSFAEHMLVPERSLMKIRDDMPLDRACLIGCGVTTGLGAALNTVHIPAGASVVIVGCGGVGLAALQGARIVGAGRIVAVDAQPWKFDLARQLGATHCVDASQGDPVAAVHEATSGDADFVFECIGLVRTVQQSIAMTGRGGTTVLVGVVPIHEMVPISAADLTLQEKKITGSYMGSNRFRFDMPRYVDFYLDGRLRLDEMISSRIGRGVAPIVSHAQGKVAAGDRLRVSSSFAAARREDRARRLWAATRGRDRNTIEGDSMPRVVKLPGRVCHERGRGGPTERHPEPELREALATDGPDGPSRWSGRSRGLPVRLPATPRRPATSWRERARATRPTSSTRTAPQLRQPRAVDARAALGVALRTRGDRVAIAMRNYPDRIRLLRGDLDRRGRVGLNAWWTTEELDYGLRDCGARVVLADPERLERITPLLGALAPLGLRVVAVRTEPGSGALPRGVERWEDVFGAHAGAALPDALVEPDDDAMILYTSGTTAHPKGVVSTHRAILQALFAFACRAIANSVARPSREPHPFPTCYILIVPLFHVTGLVPVMLGATLGGNKLVMMPSGRPSVPSTDRARARDHLRRRPDAVLTTCSSHRGSRPPPRACSPCGGGASYTTALVKRIEQLHARAAEHRLRHDRDQRFGPGNTGDALRKPASTGRVVPICEIRVIDPRPGPWSRPERWARSARGPHLFRGYWNKPKETAEVLADDGWLRTGVLGYLDDEGFLFLVDRAKDIVLRAGENISCSEVENVVYAPLGFYLRPQAWHKNIAGVGQGPLPFCWGVSKSA
jgi:S-(hydroxymethyl)glutathione dehydrogenase/alcohol dehydrogenase